MPMKKTFRKPYRIKKKKSIFRSRPFWLVILTLILAGAIFYSLFFLETFQVKKIVITGEKRVSNEELKSLVENKLENEILFLKTKSIFLVNTKTLREEILDKFPQAAEIEIKRGFPDALHLLLVERLELAIWCQEEKCFLLDNEGVIFEESPPKEELAKMIDKKNKPPLELGKEVIKKDYLEEILEAQRRLINELKIEVEEILVFSDEFRAKTLEGWEIYFSPQEDLDWQLTKLNLVLEKEIPPERRKDLEHIELRFGNFAPYKYKQPELVNTENKD